MGKKKEDNKEIKNEAEKEKNEAKPEKEETIKISDLINENLRKATSDASEFKDKYYRALAELENTRKRLQAEKIDSISYAVDNMLAEFLMPLDNLETALSYTDNMSDEMKNWAHGFKMIAGQFKEVLENHGVIPYDSVGKKFDPHFHEAVETEESNDVDEDTVIAEIQKGYRHDKRILRVARVKVAKRSTNDMQPPSVKKGE